MRLTLPSPLLFQSVLLLLGLSLGWSGHAGDPGPVIPKGKGDHCVADTDFMRRNHMDLIVHQRDETVIRGIRDEPFSLVECVDCHAQQNASNEPVRVDAEGQFCASCHAYAAVKIDCFGCHAAVPDVSELDDTSDDASERADSMHWLRHKQMLAFKPAFVTPVKSPSTMSVNSPLQSPLNSSLERGRNELINSKSE